MDIKAYLRDMDREEEEIRRAIMGMQVRLQQLADTRLLLMGREEERARRNGGASPFGTLPGEIVVRDPVVRQQRQRLLAASEAGKLSEAKKTGESLVLPSPDGGDGKLAVSAQIVRLLTAEGPLPTAEVKQRLVAVPNKKRVDNALHNLKKRGLTKVVAGSHHLTQRGQKELAKLAGKPTPGRPAAKAASGNAPQQAVLAKLAGAGPLKAGEVVTALLGPGPHAKPAKDRIYAALHSLKNAGMIAKEADFYRAASLPGGGTAA